MDSISMNQALGIWSDLEQAYYGDHPYGGNTAEIYAYRLHGHCPSLCMYPAADQTGPVGNTARETAELAARNLAKLCVEFSAKRQCRVVIDGQEPQVWVCLGPFVHRAHVKVERHGD